MSEKTVNLEDYATPEEKKTLAMLRGLSYFISRCLADQKTKLTNALSEVEDAAVFEVLNERLAMAAVVDKAVQGALEGVTNRDGMTGKALTASPSLEVLDFLSRLVIREIAEIAKPLREKRAAINTVSKLGR